MPDLLGMTNPVPGYDNAAINRNIPVSPNNTQIQNIPDPGRVVRPDGRTDQQDSGSMANSDRIRYDSNFHTFLQRLKETPNLAENLSKLFAGRAGVVVTSGMSEGIAAEMAQVLEMLRMDEKQLLDFLMGQFKAGTRFGGALFALLRNAYDRAESDSVQRDILQFLKSYTDFSSTEHIEGNLMRSLTQMADLMPASWADKLREMIAQLQNGIASGDRRGNLQLLQRQIFPYMATYVEQTHDFGPARGLLSLLALDTARYENGDEENLIQLFHQLNGYGTLKSQLGGIDERTLMLLLQRSQIDNPSKANEFSDHLAAAAARAMRGEGSAEVQQILRELVSAMLINESVYMPINHYLLPMEWEDKMLFSEMWVDPDAEQEQGGAGGGRRERTMKFLFKLDVQSLGMMDIILTCRDHDVDIQIAGPAAVSSFSKLIQQDVSRILVNNGLTPAGVTVRRMDRPVSLTEVFPKIFEGKNSVNVKI